MQLVKNKSLYFKTNAACRPYPSHNLAYFVSIEITPPSSPVFIVTSNSKIYTTIPKFRVWTSAGNVRLVVTKVALDGFLSWYYCVFPPLITFSTNTQQSHSFDIIDKI